MTDSINRQLKKLAAREPGLVERVEILTRENVRLAGENERKRREGRTLDKDIVRKKEQIVALGDEMAALVNQITDLTPIQRKLAAVVEPVGVVVPLASEKKETQDPFKEAWDRAAVVHIDDGEAGTMTLAEKSLRNAVVRRNSIQRQRNGIYVLLKSIAANYPFVLVGGARKGPHGIEAVFSMDESNSDVAELYSKPPRVLFSFSIVEDGMDQHEVTCTASIDPKPQGHEPVSLLPRVAGGGKATGWDLEIPDPRNPEAAPSFKRVKTSLYALAIQFEKTFYELAEPLITFDNTARPRGVDLDQS